jgi:hypothetical protein
LDRSKISYLITLKSRRALVWATAVWEQQFKDCLRLEDFKVEVRKVLDSLLSRKEAARKLLQPRQDSRSVADYTVVSESDWNPESLFNTFLHGLSEEIKDELAA